MATRPDSPRRSSEPTARILERLLADGAPLLRGQARRHAQLDADVEEALQSACAIFLQKYRPPAEPLPWLMTTIKREAWRLARRSSRRRELPIAAAPRCDGTGLVDLTETLLDESADPAERLEASQLLDRRRAAFAHLKPDQRTALLLLGLGYSYAEIMACQGWTYTKVNRCLAEGRAALRALGEGGESAPPGS